MIREIKINAALNGFIVNVGCQTVVFNDAKKMCEEILTYVTKPNETEKKYVTKSINVNHVGPQAQLAPYTTTTNLITCTEPLSGIRIGGLT
jgi:hypothetical protein